MNINPETVYDRIWRATVEPDGSVDMDVVKELLFGYGRLLSVTSTAFDYITGGKVSNPHAGLDEIIYEADSFTSEAMDDGIREILDAVLDLIDENSEETPENTLDNLVLWINSIYVEKGQ